MFMVFDLDEMGHTRTIHELTQEVALELLKVWQKLKDDGLDLCDGDDLKSQEIIQGTEFQEMCDALSDRMESQVPLPCGSGVELNTALDALSKLCQGGEGSFAFTVEGLCVGFGRTLVDAKAAVYDEMVSYYDKE